MAKASNKTQPTDQNPQDFLATVEPERRREEGYILLEFFNRVTAMEPVMWGSSIIGYGRYHYRYASGREGDYMLTGFSPRKTAHTIYIMPGYQDQSALLTRLGNHRIGKSCLYINKLADVDMTVLEQLVLDGLNYMQQHYPTWEK